MADTASKSTVAEESVIALSVTVFSTGILARLDLKPAIDLSIFENEYRGVSFKNKEDANT